jgi:hypothetical protein
VFNSERFSDSYDTFRGLAIPCPGFRHGDKIRPTKSWPSY